MGGLGGHMSHVYENMEMTFGELVNLFGAVSSGQIDATEKVDGQNLYFRYDSIEGQAKFARNDTHANMGGFSREALTAEFVKKGKGQADYAGVIKTFDDGMNAIQSAMSAIDPLILQKIFYRSDLYADCEVMSGDNRNIVVYNGNFIVMHGLDIVGESFDSESMTQEMLAQSDTEARGAFKLLVQAIDRQEARIAKENWEVVGPKIIKLQDLSDGDFIARLENTIDSVLTDTGLTFRNTFMDFVSHHLKNVISTSFASMPSEEVFQMILVLVTETSAEKKARISAGKVINLRTLKAMHQNLGDYNALRNVASATNAKNILAIILEPFAQITVQFSSEVLSGAESYFAQDPKRAQEILSKMTELAIERIPNRISGLFLTGKVDPKAAAEANAIQLRFDKNLARLKDVQNITTGIEGVAFEYPPMSRRFYKFTGGFAPANQLLGLLGWEGKADIMSVAQS